MIDQCAAVENHLENIECFEMKQAQQAVIWDGTDNCFHARLLGN